MRSLFCFIFTIATLSLSIIVNDNTKTQFAENNKPLTEAIIADIEIVKTDISAANEIQQYAIARQQTNSLQRVNRNNSRIDSRTRTLRPVFLFPFYIYNVKDGDYAITTTHNSSSQDICHSLNKSFIELRQLLI